MEELRRVTDEKWQALMGRVLIENDRFWLERAIANQKPKTKKKGKPPTKTKKKTETPRKNDEKKQRKNQKSQKKGD